MEALSISKYLLPSFISNTDHLQCTARSVFVRAFRPFLSRKELYMSREYEVFVESLRQSLMERLGLNEKQIYFEERDENGMTPNGENSGK